MKTQKSPRFSKLSSSFAAVIWHASRAVVAPCGGESSGPLRPMTLCAINAWKDLHDLGGLSLGFSFRRNEERGNKKLFAGMEPKTKHTQDAKLTSPISSSFALFRINLDTRTWMDRGITHSNSCFRLSNHLWGSILESNDDSFRGPAVKFLRARALHGHNSSDGPRRRDSELACFLECWIKNLNWVHACRMWIGRRPVGARK